jgi:hypothetical protein
VPAAAARELKNRAEKQFPVPVSGVPPLGRVTRRWRCFDTNGATEIRRSCCRISCEIPRESKSQLSKNGRGTVL